MFAAQNYSAQGAVVKSCPDEIRIAIIDGHELFIEGMRAVIGNQQGMTMIGHAADRLGALEVARLQPDVILMELVVGEESSLGFLPDLRRIAESARILIVTGVMNTDLQVQAARMGAVGVLLKSEPASNLIKAIHKVSSGEVWFRRSIMSAVMAGFQDNGAKKQDPEAAKIASLTAREVEVIALLGEGLRNKQIGERLFVSETTVRHYLTSIFDKLGVSDRLELIVYAYKHGLAQLAPGARSSEHIRV